jgi:hypothetical protein
MHAEIPDSTAQLLPHVLDADVLVWTKIGDDAGEDIEGILARKEAERKQGTFWWGIGSSLNREKLEHALCASGGTLAVQFSQQLSRPKKRCSFGGMRLWTHYRSEKDDKKIEMPIPSHALVVSKGKSERYYALVCRSDKAIACCDQRFNEQLFQNYPNGKIPGNIQNTALLKRKSQGDHGAGRYKSGFAATLVSPFFVTLTSSRQLTPDEERGVAKFRAGGDYNDLVQRIRLQG